ncbi:MAG: branched-chain amino acid aminotransferase [Clostridiaceae bacterium]
MEIDIRKAAQLKEKPTNVAGLGFGKSFTDHMFIMEYDAGVGWHDARIQPYSKLEIDPASAVLHYAQEIFEGLKAYRTAQNEVLLFRPQDNAARLNISARRMVMPEIDPAFNVEVMKKLVDLERDWVPRGDGTSLYLRPTMIADGAELGVHASKRYLYYIICAATGMYYTKGFAPIRIYVEDNYVRAVRGGVGGAKTGGNYAASLRASEEALEKGYNQVLWLDAVERKYVQEVGAMNMMFLLGDTVCTAPVDGSILDGITRRSILQLVKDMGYKVEERPISIDELYAAGESGMLKEAFGTGTAAIITPVSEFCYKGRCLVLNGGKIGALTQKLYDTLTGIQRGDLADPYGWTVRV